MKNTLYMIHGMWGGGWYWDKYIRYFEKRGYACKAPTLRHHDTKKDDTPNPQLGTTSILDYAADLEDEIKTLENPPVIVGHSMGGLLAQILASRGFGKALVLLAPAPPAGVFAMKPTVLKSFFSSITTYGFWKRPIFPTFEEAVYSTLQRVPAEEQKNIYSRFVYESGRAGSEIGFYVFDKKGASRVDESKVTCPILVIAGGKDRITPASVVKKVAAKYGQADYKEFPENAHWVVGEPGWEQIAEYVEGWLKEKAV